MKRKRIKSYLEKRMRSFEKYAMVILSCDDMEAIHQLRVGFKKLRAFLRLATLEPSAEKQQVPSKLKKIYKYAGAVRDLQIYYHNVVPFYHKADNYPQQVLQQIAVAKYILVKALKSFPFRRTTKQLKRKAPDRVSKKTIDRFIQKKSKAIDRSIGTNIRDARLHVLKKYLKDVFYSLKAFQAPVQSYFPIAGKGNMSELSKLSDVLNEYLDWIVGLSFLNTALSGKLSLHDKVILQGIKKNWTSKKGQVRRRAMTMLRS